jgi:hypothetical protein
MAYLYGAAAEGIQGYIFATNKLKEMVGASELVENLCTGGFQDFLDSLASATIDEPVAPQAVLGAAGNIKWIFQNRTLLDQVVLRFPLYVRKTAPGLAISQAVVEFSPPLRPEHLDELEKKIKAQRNRPARPAWPDWAACTRCPRTGRPAYSQDSQSGLIDESLAAKIETAKDDSSMARLACKMIHGKPDGRPVYKCGEKELRFPYDLDEITKGRENTWLAVVHADGNALGALIQSLSAQMRSCPRKTADVFRQFSQALDVATTRAAHTAFEELMNEVETKHLKALPLRPLILGGDDITLIIRADLAVEFTVKFLTYFTKETAKELEFLTDLGVAQYSDGLTACAGIAFIKHSYPFYYAYDLAEALCVEAKKHSKVTTQAREGRIPASLAFFKVQSAFSEDWGTIRERELTIQKFDQDKPLRLDFGPYALDNLTDMPCLNTMLSAVDTLGKPNAPVSGLRRWLSLLYNEPAQSSFYLERLQNVTGEDFHDKDLAALEKDLGNLGNGISLKRPYCERKGGYASPVGDMLTLLGMEKN